MKFSTAELSAQEKSFRANLVNSLSGFKSACLAGTVNREGGTNLAVISSVFHLGAHPPLCGMVIRPHTVPRHTLENLLATGEYTLNHITGDIYTQAHQTSARYPGDISEFDATGLTPHYEQGFAAPYVTESRIRIGVQYREHHHLAINDTVMVIGEIVAVSFPDDCLESDGTVDIERAGTLAISGLDGYHETRRLNRMAYAKPNLPPKCRDQ